MLTDDPIVQVKCGYLHPRLTCSDQYICQNRHRRLPFDDPLCTVERLLKFVRGNPEFHKPSSRRRSSARGGVARSSSSVNAGTLVQTERCQSLRLAKRQPTH